MRLLGFSITREKAAGTTRPVDNLGSWRSSIQEGFTGAWQQGVTVERSTVLAYPAVFACQTLIASDIAKLRVKLVKKDSHGIWSEVKNPAYSPVLRKPNSRQNRIQFFESWMLSKLQCGNAYILKTRDARNVVTALDVLDPAKVTPLVSASGEVFYRLGIDNIAGLEESLTVPASEVIHDRFNCLFHPLVGLSPIYAAGIAAIQGNAIQNASAKLFQNGARPGGLLSAPGAISDETAKRLKDYWDANFTGANAGKVAVLGDGLKFEALAVVAKDAQVVEQLKWADVTICSVYHTPPYKIGAGQMPTVNNVQGLNLEYYSQCLQIHIEAIELCLDEGLGMDGETIGTEFDLDGLLRMDSVAQMDVLEKAKGKLTVDEQRAKLGYGPKPGGNTIYLQEQDHSLEWLAKRDAMPIEAKPSEPSEPAPPPANDNADAEARAALAIIRKGLA